MAKRTYSVPSRLIGMEVAVRLYADQVEVYYKGRLVERMERLHGSRRGAHRLPPHHRIAGSQARCVRPVPVQGADVPDAEVQAGIRRAAWMER